jgi:hypothetical protein
MLANDSAITAQKRFSFSTDVITVISHTRLNVQHLIFGILYEEFPMGPKALGNGNDTEYGPDRFRFDGTANVGDNTHLCIFLPTGISLTCGLACIFDFSQKKEVPGPGRDALEC